MGNFIGQLAQQAAQGALGAGMGLLLEGHNDRRQLRQQRALQDIQMEGQRSMTNFNMGKQLEMWDKTNYGAQKQHMIKAGLNPALMYGMSGGGGATTGIQTGNVEGGKAPSGGREVIDSMGIQNQTAQLQLLQAQKANIEADTANKQADTTKKTGVDTLEAQTRIKDLTQGIENKKALEHLTKVQKNLADLELAIKNDTQKDVMDYIEYQTKQAFQNLQMAENEAYISRETLQQKIDIIVETAIGAGLQNKQTKAQTAKTQEETAQLAKQIKLAYDQLKNETDRTAIQKQLADFETSFGKQASNILQSILGAANPKKTIINQFR